MERFTKQQKKILNSIAKYPKGLTDVDLERELDINRLDMLDDINLLEEKDYITTRGRIGSYVSNKGNFPMHIKITPKGIEKPPKNFLSRLLDEAYQHPWIVVSIVVSIILAYVW